MSPLEALARWHSNYAWTHVEAGNIAVSYKNPMLIKAEEEEKDKTYIVTIYYPFVKIILKTTKEGEVLDCKVIDFEDMLNEIKDILNDIYGELYNLARQ